MIPSQWVDETTYYGVGITRLRFKDVYILVYRNNGWIFDKRAENVDYSLDIQIYDIHKVTEWYVHL